LTEKLKNSAGFEQLKENQFTLNDFPFDFLLELNYFLVYTPKQIIKT